MQATGRTRVGSRPSSCAWLVMLVAWSLAASASAQQWSGLTPGERLRVSLRCSMGVADQPPPCAGSDRQEGTLVRVLDDALMLERRGSTVTYLFPSIMLLEAARGSSSRWKAGGIIGFVAGTAATFAVLNSGSPSSTNACDPENNQDAVGGKTTCLLLAGVVGGLPGGLLGALVGSLFRTERWQRVSLPGVELSVFPVGSSPTLAVSMPLP